MPPIPTPVSGLRTLSQYTQRISQISRTLRSVPSQTVQPWTRIPPRTTSIRRFNSISSQAESRPRPLTDRATNSQSPTSKRAPQPEYEMTFTCKPCGTRSSHRVSKQGYHYGSTLITCPECRNRHIISDHLNIFGDKAMTIEDLMRERGELVKKGTLSEDGDLEFWEDGTTTKRANKEDVAEQK